MAKGLPLVLMILDGWGYSQEKNHNAIASAHTPQWDLWWKTRPHTLLKASGTPVGLPNGQMGNSEVGHMHIGAGRILPQDFTRINQAIEEGYYQTNPVFLELINDTKKTGRALHIMGLLSPGGVHSHQNHLFAFLAMCKAHQVKDICLHLFLDGRDTPPKSALASLESLNNELLHYPAAKICSMTGRYYAMDRDQRYERVAPIYRLLTEGYSEHQFVTAEDCMNAFYQQQIHDEFIPPSLIGSPSTINDGDSIFFFNFRADRARQLTETFVNAQFSGFKRDKQPRIAHFVSMTHYADTLPTECAFPPLALNNTLGEVIASHGMRQLRLAETEKYAHVTFFLNGGSEQVFANENRILIPSPKVATYDLQPEMSAPQLTQTLIDAIQREAYDVIICNYANADMVGHTGNFSATQQAIEYLDKAMHDVWQALAEKNGQLLITADHGNAESMFDDATHQAHTAHTNEPVPLLYVGKDLHFNTKEGSLIDIAPTVLSLLGINPPKEMTGNILLEDTHAQA